MENGDWRGQGINEHAATTHSRSVEGRGEYGGEYGRVREHAATTYNRSVEGSMEGSGNMMPLLTLEVWRGVWRGQGTCCHNSH